MFQHTLDRADKLTDPEHKVTVIASAHRAEAWSQLKDRHPGRIIEQPANRDTGVGVFLALAYIRARDSQATIVLHPSDHFVHPEEQLIEVLRCAVKAVHHLKGRPILLGVKPDRLEQEYGWIQPGHDFGRVNGLRVRAVQSFLEKPSATEAATAILRESLWNTMIMVSGAEWLWGLGWQHVPEMMSSFEYLKDAFQRPDEDDFLEAAYQNMPSKNLSFDVLARASDQVAVIEMGGVLWNDWGNWQRISDTLGRIGKYPAFALTQASKG
jgi:mannose-1-phosphate guanylyltransferase